MADVPRFIDDILKIVVPFLAGMTANFAYYLHVVKLSQSSNPFEGFGS